MLNAKHIKSTPCHPTFHHSFVMMYVIAAGIRETGGMELLARYLLGRPKGMVSAQARMMLPVALISGFMNNTPLVATFIPAILNWAKRLRISPSKLLLPQRVCLCPAMNVPGWLGLSSWV